MAPYELKPEELQEQQKKLNAVVLDQKTENQQENNATYVEQQISKYNLIEAKAERDTIYSQVRNKTIISTMKGEYVPPLPLNWLGGKKRKKIEKQIQEEQEKYKQLGKTDRFLSMEEIADLKLMQHEYGLEYWRDEKVSHSELTREETMRKILRDGDYSNFENLDGVMRNVVASTELTKFLRKYKITEKNLPDPQALCEQIYKDTKENGGGVSGLLNPGLRLGLSLARRSEQFKEGGMQEFFRRLDEEMSAKVMEVTLTHHVNDDKSKLKLKEHFRDKKEKNPEKKTDEAIKAHRAQQIQIAKRLLMVHLSKLTKVTKDAAGVKHNEEWNEENPTPVSVLFSHCSRVTVTLPRKVEREGSGNTSEYHDRMWRAITTINGENSAQDNRRGGSTHSVKRRKVADTEGVTSKEKKVLVNAIGQRGMNCAIGGLGNAGIGKKMLNNDGSCGHFYSMHKEADTRHYGAMLMGLESDANGVTNQMGHTHDIHATPEKASSLGGQRVDEIGEKYGGRQSDLTGLSAKEIEAWMLGLERFMQSAHEQFYKEDPLIDDSYHKEYLETMKILAGKKISDQQRDDLYRTLGIGRYLGNVRYT